MNLEKFFKLNESVLDSVKPTLSKDLWIDWEIKKSVKIYIMKKIEVWLSQYTKEKIKHAFIIGSMAGFQYNDEADIDVNFVVEIPEEKTKKIRKFLPNGHNLPGTNHPINYYLENKIMKEWKEGPIFDLLNNKWINKPKKEEAKPAITNFKAVIEIARFFISGINASISEYEADVHAYETYADYLNSVKKEDIDEVKQMINLKLQEILADIDGILIAKHMIKALRAEAFKKDPEDITISTEIHFKSANTSINNLIYKYIERLGYFEKIIEILKTKDKWKSLLDKQ